MENQLNITSARYIRFGNENSGITAVIDGVTMGVPVDPANRHYAAIKAKHDDPNDSFNIADAD